MFNTGTYSAKKWLMTASSGTLASSAILDCNDYKTIDTFRDFVALNDYTSVEDYLINFFSFYLDN